MCAIKKKYNYKKKRMPTSGPRENFKEKKK